MRFNWIMSSVFLVTFLAATVASKAATINVPGDQPTIQAGIDAAISGVDEVVVAPGTYNELINLNGKAITLRSSGGAAVTTIDATLAADPGDGKPVVRCDNGEGSDTSLDGFTVTGGTGDSVYLVPFYDVGGGMFINASSPTIANCSFVNNSTDAGGGIWATNASKPLIVDCTFTNNQATCCGGGIMNDHSDPMILNCIFTDNTAVDDGGGMFNQFSSPTVANCIFQNNSAVGGNATGGGMFNAGNPLVLNCLFSANTATAALSGVSLGGGMRNQLNVTQVVVIGCTFHENGADLGGAIYNDVDSVAKVYNSLLWGNTSDQLSSDGSGLLAVNYSCIQGGFVGLNNISSDPLFVTGPQGNFYLSQISSGQAIDSPCVDSGKGLAVHHYYSGTTRTDESDDAGIVDMGYHYNAKLATPGDLDGDMDVDLNDFLIFSACFNDALNPPRPICENFLADLDFDGDVDSNDFLTFSNCFNGALNPPNCP